MNIFELIIAFVLAGTLLECAKFFIMPKLFVLHREKCGQCGTKLPAVLIRPICRDCLAKNPEGEIVTPFPPSVPNLAGDMVENIKQFYKDPEAVKIIKKAFGLQTEKERFEDEASGEDGLSDITGIRD